MSPDREGRLSGPAVDCPSWVSVFILPPPHCVTSGLCPLRGAMGTLTASSAVMRPPHGRLCAQGTAPWAREALTLCAVSPALAPLSAQRQPGAPGAPTVALTVDVDRAAGVGAAQGVGHLAGDRF